MVIIFSRKKGKSMHYLCAEAKNIWPKKERVHNRFLLLFELNRAHEKHSTASIEKGQRIKTEHEQKKKTTIFG